VKKLLYIETLGCQMNTRDSEHLIAELKDDYSLTSSIDKADLILINTCSVREKPVNKLFSELGEFKKKRKTGAKIGVCGCTASHLGDEIIKKAPYVSFVLGARNVSKISDVINKKGSVEVDINYDESNYSFSEYRNSLYKADINISIGCDKKCTFCIVPATRGDEISIPSELILQEIEKACNSGVKEINLLGQNVNNYGRRFSNSKDNNSINFTELLRKISKIDKVERIRFTSPHPLHMDNEFINEFATNDKICKSIHIPLQSGSTKILKDMKRGYSKEWFLKICQKIRDLVPSARISTDIIVGFPGETDNDFKDTIDVINQVRFEQIFNFKYSERPLTQAIDFSDKVDGKISSERLTEIIELHKQHLEEISKNEIGKIYQVLFDDLKPYGVITGRTDNGIIVKIKGSEELLGKTKKIKIIKTNRMYLEAELV